MLSDIEKFGQSGKQITSAELVEAMEKSIKTIHTMWETSPSKDSVGREECYRQVKGIEMVVMQLIRELEK